VIARQRCPEHARALVTALGSATGLVLGIVPVQEGGPALVIVPEQVIVPEGGPELLTGPHSSPDWGTFPALVIGPVLVTDQASVTAPELVTDLGALATVPELVIAPEDREIAPDDPVTDRGTVPAVLVIGRETASPGTVLLAIALNADAICRTASTTDTTGGTTAGITTRTGTAGTAAMRPITVAGCTATGTDTTTPTGTTCGTTTPLWRRSASRRGE